jgi:hypothetical protein
MMRSFLVDAQSKLCYAFLNNFISLVSMICNIRFPYVNLSRT